MSTADFTLTGHVGLDTSAKRTNSLTRVMRAWTTTYLNNLKEGRLSGNPINRRTGNLARDWTMRVDETPVGLVATVGTHGLADKYAGLQEYGGTITPKTSKWLWIPLKANLNGSGVAKLTPRQAIQAGGFISYKKNESPVFMGVTGSKSKRNTNFNTIPLYVLRKSVTIKGRMGATKLWEYSIPRLEATVGAILQDEF